MTWCGSRVMSSDSFKRHYAVSRTSSFTSIVTSTPDGPPKLKILQSHIPVARLSFRYSKRNRKTDRKNDQIPGFTIDPNLSIDNFKLDSDVPLKISDEDHERGTGEPNTTAPKITGHKKLTRALPHREPPTPCLKRPVIVQKSNPEYPERNLLGFSYRSFSPFRLSRRSVSRELTPRERLMRRITRIKDSVFATSWADVC